MDWGNVTVEDLIEALREVDWSSPPRPFYEFFSRFTVPRSYAKWNSRLKCNLYYYRTNYFILIVFIIGVGFLRRPLALVAALMAALSIAFLNDRYFQRNGYEICQATFSTFSCQNETSPYGLTDGNLKFGHCYLDLSAVSFVRWFVSCGNLVVLWAFTSGLLVTFLHASFRTPNLKARLNTF